MMPPSRPPPLPPLRLRHIHLPTPSTTGHATATSSTTSSSSSSFSPPPYSLASRLQSHLRRRLLDFKDYDSSTTKKAIPPTATLPTPPPLPPPPSTPPLPTLISFSPLPIYTLGRRQTTPLTPEESSRLQAPLRLPFQHGSSIPVQTLHSPRGGLTTYHGPGQIVLWPIIDLRSKQHAQYTVRCYSRLLENTTIATLKKLFGLKAVVTDDPGVWVSSCSSFTSSSSSSTTTCNINAAAAAAAVTTSHCSDGEKGQGQGQGQEEEKEQELQKIAALGVHLRRHVSGLGTAINVDMDPSWEGSEATNPWKRITACGLEGKRVTSVREALGHTGRERLDDALTRYFLGEKANRAREEMVADAWAKEFSDRIAIDDGAVEKVKGAELVELLRNLLEETGKEEEVGEEEMKYFEDLDREVSKKGGI